MPLIYPRKSLLSFHKHKVYVLGSNFDEFAEKLDSFTKVCSKAHFCYNPVLDFIKAAEEYIKIGSDTAKLVTAKY